MCCCVFRVCLRLFHVRSSSTTGVHTCPCCAAGLVIVAWTVGDTWGVLTVICIIYGRGQGGVRMCAQFQVDWDVRRTGEQDLTAQFNTYRNLCERHVSVWKRCSLSHMSSWGLWLLNLLLCELRLEAERRCCVSDTHSINCVLGALWLWPETLRLPFDLEGLYSWHFTTPALLPADDAITSPPIGNLRV